MIQVWSCDDNPSLHIFSRRVGAKQVKSSKYDERLPKSKGKIAKCTNCGISENLSGERRKK